MGPNVPVGPDPWSLPPQGGPSADRATCAVASQQGVFLSTPGRGYAEGRAGDYRNQHRSPSKHNYPIYCNSSDIVAVSSSGAVPSGMSNKAVVVTWVMDWEGTWEAKIEEELTGTGTEEDEHND